MSELPVVARPADPAGTPAAEIRRLLVVATLGLVGGLVTALAQQWLPHSLASLANSAGPWGLLAFALALLPRTAIAAAVAGGLALLTLVSGYYGFNELRGHPASSRAVLFWGLAATTAGPVLGLASHWVRARGPRPWPAVGAGVVSGMLVGEGIYGLLYISDTTSPPYWWCEILGGLGVLLMAVVLRLRSPRETLVAALVAAATATVFVVAFGVDVLSRLSIIPT